MSTLVTSDPSMAHGHHVLPGNSDPSLHAITDSPEVAEQTDATGMSWRHKLGLLLSAGALWLGTENTATAQQRGNPFPRTNDIGRRLGDPEKKAEVTSTHTRAAVASLYAMPEQQDKKLESEYRERLQRARDLFAAMHENDTKKSANVQSEASFHLCRHILPITPQAVFKQKPELHGQIQYDLLATLFEIDENAAMGVLPELMRRVAETRDATTALKILHLLRFKNGSLTAEGIQSLRIALEHIDDNEVRLLSAVTGMQEVIRPIQRYVAPNDPEEARNQDWHAERNRVLGLSSAERTNVRFLHQYGNYHALSLLRDDGDTEPGNVNGHRIERVFKSDPRFVTDNGDWMTNQYELTDDPHLKARLARMIVQHDPQKGIDLRMSEHIIAGLTEMHDLPELEQGDWLVHETEAALVQIEREAIRKSSTQQSPVAEAIIQSLQHEDEYVRLSAAHFAGVVDEEQKPVFVQEEIRAVTAPNVDKVAEALIGVLNDESENVRDFAVMSLVRRGAIPKDEGRQAFMAHLGNLIERSTTEPATRRYFVGMLGNRELPIDYNQREIVADLKTTEKKLDEAAQQTQPAVPAVQPARVVKRPTRRSVQ